MEKEDQEVQEVLADEVKNPSTESGQNSAEAVAVSGLESQRTASEQGEWTPERVDCDCCGLPMEFIGLSLYACRQCPSDCDGQHGVDDFGGEGPTGCMDEPGDELGRALRGVTHQDLNRILDESLNAPERVSRCCDAPIYFVYDCGPVCTKCGKWAVTKEAANQHREVSERVQNQMVG